jgi:cytolysin (calcineurin-like family phosphatase)
MLLTNVGTSFAYSHLVVASKFPMLLSATQKGEPRFSMTIEVRDALVACRKKAVL